MTRILRVEHEDGFDLVAPEHVQDHPIYGALESLGTRDVAGLSSGELLTQHKVRLPHIVYTDCELPEDYEGTPQELVHLLQSWNDRHFDKPTAVTGDETVGPKVAALLGVPYNGATLADVVVPEMPMTEAQASAPAQTPTDVPSQAATTDEVAQ